MPASRSISVASATVSSTTSAGPPPRSTSTASATSRALPTVAPSGVDMSVSRALTAMPWLSPMDTRVAASSLALSSFFMKAPEPTLTSSTRPSAPSATFFPMIDPAIRGMDSTVPVTSRSAYSLRSAGASPSVGAQTTAPTEFSCATISAVVRRARHPGMDSSLSRVPPVWPRPRPESWGTAAPQVATSGASGRVILSPTPPVECLSTVGRSTSVRSSRSPERTIARVQRPVSRSVIPFSRIAIARAAICSSATAPAL